MAPFEMKQVEAALTAKASNLSAADVARVATSRAAVERMIEEFPADWTRTRRQALLLLDLLESGRAPLEAQRFAAGALIYLGAAIDLVPDDEEGGLEDDAAIIDRAIARCEEFVRVLCAERGTDPGEYL